MEDLERTCGRRAKTLLLLYLFVMKAAADCPVPPDRENIVLSNDALLQNTFPDGLDVTLECAKGFVTASGSGVITCIENKWTQPDLVCKKMDCGRPKPQPHMDFIFTKEGTLFGASMEVVCAQGYEVNGLKHRKCYPGGWSGKATCERIVCFLPSPVANGRNSWVSAEEPYYGDTIRYFCDEGYTMVGNDSIVCSDEGEYDPQPPTCQRVTTEDRLTTKMITSTSTPPKSTPPTSTPPKSTPPTSTPPTSTPPKSTPPASEATTSTDSPTTATALRDKTVTITATPAVSPSPRDNEAVETNKDVGYVPVIVSVICITLAVCLVALFLHKFLLKRKGSYDTREDLKPELLQFQNL